jgi:hypothetical protein
MAAVTPADIYDPWLASVPRAQPVPPPSSEKEVWNSSVDTFNTWWAKTERTLFNHGLAPMAKVTRRTYGQMDPAHADNPNHEAHVAYAQDPIFGAAIPIPNGWLAPAKQRAAQINAEQRVYIQQARGRWCTAVIDRIEEATAQLILDPTKPELLTDPDKLYDATKKRAVGGSAAEVGPRTFREAHGITWETKGTMMQQADGIVTKYRAIAARFQAIGDGDYSMSEPAMVAAITMRAPKEFDMSVIAKLEACKNLSELQTEMQKAARRIDERVPTGLNAFVSTATTDAQDSRLQALEASILRIEAKLTGGGGGGGGGGDASNKYHCTKHGWGRHSSARCYTLHPEKAPAGWVVNPKDDQK